MKMKVIGRFVVQVPEPISRNKNYIDRVDLAQDYNFWRKVYEIESEGWYSDRQRQFLKSILEFLDAWEYISWKQYNLIMGMKKKDPDLELPIVKVQMDDHTYYEEVDSRETVFNLIREAIDSKHPEEAMALWEHNQIF